MCWRTPSGRDSLPDLIETLVPATSRWLPLALAAPALASCRRPTTARFRLSGRRSPAAGRLDGWTPRPLIVPRSSSACCSSACYYQKPVGGGLLWFGIGRFATTPAQSQLVATCFHLLPRSLTVWWNVNAAHIFLFARFYCLYRHINTNSKSYKFLFPWYL